MLLASSCTLLTASPQLAQAHVRWFTQVSEADAPPLSPMKLIAMPEFIGLLLLTLAVLALVRRVDMRLASSAGSPTMGFLGELDAWMTHSASRVLRCGLALFFTSIALYFAHAPITLTPELKTSSTWVGPLQLLIAVGMVAPGGVIPACIGMLVLYVYSAHLYGLVHMVDYHLFFGVIVFLVLATVSARRGAATGLLVLRTLVATSLLWVGMEKWIYPEWTCDILEHQLPVLTMGMDPDFWAIGAGFVEVALAFLLLFGGVSSQVAAAVLLAMMSAAIPLVGAVDAIGHLPILFVLFVLATTRNRLPRWLAGYAGWTPMDLCKVYLVGVSGLLGLYFLSHRLEPVMTTHTAEGWPDIALAATCSLALAAWITRVVLQHRHAAVQLHAAGR